jgi:hypothetical protein
MLCGMPSIREQGIDRYSALDRGKGCGISNPTMKTSVYLLTAVALAFTTFGCSTPEQRQQRKAQYAREDARRDAEDRKRDQQYDSGRWDDFLADYAHRLGKAKSELTASERAEARQEFNRDGGYGRGYGYGYHHWYY